MVKINEFIDIQVNKDGQKEITFFEAFDKYLIDQKVDKEHIAKIKDLIKDSWNPRLKNSEKGRVLAIIDDGLSGYIERGRLEAKKELSKATKALPKTLPQETTPVSTSVQVAQNNPPPENTGFQKIVKSILPGFTSLVKQHHKDLSKM